MASLRGPIPSADWPSLYQINPEFESLVSGVKGFNPFAPGTSIESIRALSDRAPPSKPWADVKEKDVKLPTRDGAENRARVYSPLSQDEGEAGKARPLFVMLHGGGYCLGKFENEEAICRTWVRKFGGIALSIEHRKAPEFKFPTAINDTYDAVKWIAGNHAFLGADPSKGFILGGVSSGAVTMLVLSHFFRDESLVPPITGLFISIPPACVVSALPSHLSPKCTSWEQCADAPLFNPAASNFLASHYQADPSSPLRSPLLFPSHKNLPPTYFAIGGMDPWRDPGLLYEEKVREEGGKTRLDIFPGLVHGFWSFFPEANFAKEYREKSEEALEWLLEQST